MHANIDIFKDLGLEPLIAETQVALSGGILQDYHWRYRTQIFHASCWTDYLVNRFQLVVKETAKSVFFVPVPATRQGVSVPGEGGYGTERPDTSAIVHLMQTPRYQQRIARKLTCAAITGPSGPEFRADGLTYKLWDGKEHPFDLRRS